MLSICQENDWSLVYESEGIVVYNRPFEGSSLKEFKGITIIDARIDIVGEVLKDIPSYCQWMKDVEEATILSESDSDNIMIYLIQKAPWPVYNRDMILKVKTNAQLRKGKSQIFFTALNTTEIPEKKSIVRVTDLTGSYHLEYIDSRHTRVTYCIKLNPGGFIPAYIANMSSKKVPFEVLQGLKEVIKKSKYAELAKQSADSKLINNLIETGVLER